MNRRLVTHIMVMLIAFMIGGFIAKQLNSSEAKNAMGGKAFSTTCAGFNKFASDIQWMLFVNYSGSIKSVNKETSPIVYKKLKAIIANDPSFSKAYEIGALMLSVEEPEKALEILEIGFNNKALSSNWKIPFYAGYILTHHFPDKETNKTLSRAEKYFKAAVSRSAGSERHVMSQLIYVKAKERKNDGSYTFSKEKVLPVTSDKQARIIALFDEWKDIQKRNSMMNSMNMNTMNTSSTPAMNYSPIGGENFNTLNYEEIILPLMQSAKQSESENKDVIDTIALVRSEMFKGRHLCDKCIFSFGPGEKFCSSCGATVQTYGLCPKCSAVVKGRFCSSCGTDAVPPKKVEQADRK